MNDKLDIHWYPGHMTKARRNIESDLKFIDLVAEIADARAPFSSRNPELASITGTKPRLLILNKTDLADGDATRRWAEHFEKSGQRTLTAGLQSAALAATFKKAAKEILSEMLEKNRQKGISSAMRVMLCGIPNTGKSAIINRISKSSKTRVEDRPGVTRGKQWITVDRELELLDTPGVLWPRLDHEKTALLLAFTGAVKDKVMDICGLALKFIEHIKTVSPAALEIRYGVKPEGDPATVFDNICKARGMIIRGGELDYERCAAMLLDEFRAGKLGRITLETPDE